MRNPRGLDEAAVAGLLADMNARYILGGNVIQCVSNLVYIASMAQGWISSLGRAELVSFKVVSMIGVRSIVGALSSSSSLRWQGNSSPREMCLLSGESTVYMFSLFVCLCA